MAVYRQDERLLSDNKGDPATTMCERCGHVLAIRNLKVSWDLQGHRYYRLLNEVQLSESPWSFIVTSCYIIPLVLEFVPKRFKERLTVYFDRSLTTVLQYTTRTLTVWTAEI